MSAHSALAVNCVAIWRIKCWLRILWNKDRPKYCKLATGAIHVIISSADVQKKSRKAPDKLLTEVNSRCEPKRQTACKQQRATIIRMKRAMHEIDSFRNLIEPYVRAVHVDALTVLIGLLAIATFWLVWIASWQNKDIRNAQRAYLAVEPLGIRLLLEANRAIGLIGIRNAGHLAARKVSCFISLKQSEKDDEKLFPLEKPNGAVVIPPGAMARMSGVQTLVQDSKSTASQQRDNTWEKPTYLYVWGIVYYNDGFRAKRFTKFCHRYTWRKIDTSEIRESDARYHNYANDAN